VPHNVSTVVLTPKRQGWILLCTLVCLNLTPTVSPKKRQHCRFSIQVCFSLNCPFIPAHLVHSSNQSSNHIISSHRRQQEITECVTSAIDGRIYALGVGALYVGTLWLAQTTTNTHTRNQWAKGCRDCRLLALQLDNLHP
jgi:hypothetical protein